jgi:hypothetical protein
MNIIIGDFTLVQTEFGYDLNRTIKGKRIGDGDLHNPTGEEFDKKINIGYFSNVENALLKIIQLNLLDRTENVSIERFVEEYKKERDRVYSLLK